MKFGKLTVIEEINKRSSNGCKIYLCRCDCGCEFYIEKLWLNDKEYIQ